MKKKKIVISEKALRNAVSEVLRNYFCESKVSIPKVLYHKSPKSCRKSIMSNGLIPSVGDSYSCHYDGSGKELTPYVFLYDHSTVKGGEYDSTYDDDIYSVDVSQLDVSHIKPDIDEYMTGCFVYDLVIPVSAIKLIYRGSNRDSGDLSKHSYIYENKRNEIEFSAEKGDYDDIYVSASQNGQQMGYAILVIHKYIDDLESEISDTDSYDMAKNVIRHLEYNKPIVEIADIDVSKKYRNLGVAKQLINFIVERYPNYQFYLRVCPTDGVDEQTFANSIIKLGFNEVGNSENGTFLVKR